VARVTTLDIQSSFLKHIEDLIEDSPETASQNLDLLRASGKTRCCFVCVIG